MKDFQLHIPTRIYFGPSQGTSFVEHVAGVSNKVLLVRGGGSVERLGYLASCKTLLQEAGCELVEYEGVEANPDVSSINEAAQIAAQEDVTGVVALGGGSVMDAAKAIAALVASGEEDIWPFVAGQSRQNELTAALPIFAIPTTAATASEVTPFAVISNRATHGKAPIAYECIKPTASWLNPQFTSKLPAKVTQDGAADILSHVFENYFIGGSDAVLTDRYCESIISTVLETLPALRERPEDEGLRGTMMWCSTLALNGMQLSGRVPAGFPLHAIEHAMSAVLPELAHGRGLATLYPAYFRWLLDNNRAKERLERFGIEVFGLSPSARLAEETIDAFSVWLKENELLQSATELGLEKEQFPVIAQGAIATSGVDGALDALGPLRENDICAILELTQQQSMS